MAHPTPPGLNAGVGGGKMIEISSLDVQEEKGAFNRNGGKILDE